MTTISGGDKLNAALDKIAKKLKQAASVEVGFLEGSTYPDGTSVPMIAAVQEFGSPSRGIPPRPFFRTMIAEKSPSWGKAIAAQLAAADYDAATALDRVGMGIKGQLQKSIVAMNSPPNSPVTNLLKQRFPMGGQTFDDVLKARYDISKGATAPAGKPLVQSGNMLNSVDYKVTT